MGEGKSVYTHSHVVGIVHGEHKAEGGDIEMSGVDVRCVLKLVG